MLKSEVKNLSEKNELPFPKLMANDDGNVIILAIAKSNENIYGIVVGGGLWRVGYYSEVWATDSFTDFYGSVTLTQTPE